MSGLDSENAVLLGEEYGESREEVNSEEVAVVTSRRRRLIEKIREETKLSAAEERLYNGWSWISDTLGNVFWITAAMIVFHLTDFHILVTVDPRVDKDWIYISIATFSINFAIAAYYICYLSCLKKISPDDWEHQSPRYLIPIATMAFIFGLFTMTVAIWPVWRWLSPVIIFFLFMGFIISISLIPSFGAQGKKVD